jgi:hypothetical protein
MRKLGMSLILGLMALLSAVQTPAQSAVPATLVIANRLPDPRTGNILAPPKVLIQGNKIKQVGPPCQMGGPADAKIIDPTTICNLGHSGIDGDTELHDAINAGRVPGPRMLASRRKLVTRGETCARNLNPALAESILQQEFLFLDGADQARQAVRQNEFYNVDILKVSAEEDLTVPEPAAAVEEAHRAHLNFGACH